MNQNILKIQLENLPKLKAGEVNFKTKVTIDTNGYIHVEYVCINTGDAKEAVYIYPNMINYQTFITLSKYSIIIYTS